MFVKKNYYLQKIKIEIFFFIIVTIAPKLHISTIMQRNISCCFCLNTGIPLPHNHTIRDFTKKDKPIICPTLLSSECSYCHKLGHTKNYCLKLKERKHSSSIIYPPKEKTASEKKRVFIIDSDGFTSVPSTNKSINSPLLEKTNKVPRMNTLMSAFGALDMECASSDDSEEYKDIEDQDKKCNKESEKYTYYHTPCGENDKNQSWAHVVSSTECEVNDFPTLDELRRRLGIVPGLSWAEQSED